MKKLLLTLFILVNGALPAATFAEKLDLVVVDLQRVLSSSKLGKAAKSNIEAKFKGKKEKLQNLETEINQGKANVQKQASLLSQEAIQKKIGELQTKEREFNDLKAALREEFLIQENAEVEAIIVKIKEILADLQETENFTAVVQKDPRLVVFSSPEVDFTAKVIDLLDESAS